MAHDIPKKPASEARLGCRPDELQIVLGHTPFLLTHCSSGLRYLFVSESYARMLGRRPEDIAGKPIIEIMGKEGFETIRPYVQKVLQGQVVEYESDVHFAGAGLRRLRVNYTPERDAHGRVKGWIASIIDISADAELQGMTILQQLGAELTCEDARFDECLGQILSAAISLGRAEKGTVQLFDYGLNTLRIAVHRGFSEPFLRFFERVHDGAAACAAALQLGKLVIVEDVLTDAIFAGQPAQQVLLNEGVRAVISVPLKSCSGATLGVLSIHFTQPHCPTERDLRFIHLLVQQSADYLQRKRSEAWEKTLLKEIQHRTKNLLAVVQGIASQMVETDPKRFRERFRDRLAALARSQDLLFKSQWQGVEMSSLIQGQLGHLGELVGRRVMLTGPVLRLTAAAAQPLGMVLHELATNASKYGALSSGSGQIAIAWDLTRTGLSDERFTLSWVESGGPPVEIPHRHGFGTFVIEEMPTFQLDADVDLSYLPSGLKWQLDCPAAGVLSSGQEK
jgi:PAS domain S-box-containing protein